jgi:hypothetical protein
MTWGLLSRGIAIAGSGIEIIILLTAPRAILGYDATRRAG